MILESDYRIKDSKQTWNSWRTNCQLQCRQEKEWKMVLAMYKVIECFKKQIILNQVDMDKLTFNLVAA